MKKVILFVMLVVSMTACNAFYYYHEDVCEGLKIVEKDFSKKGFANANNEIVIPCKYDDVKNFLNGYAFVCKGNKWGVIDRNGENVIPIEYDDYQCITDSIVVLAIGGLWGAVNLEGDEVIPFRYTKIGKFSQGYATAQRERTEADPKITIETPDESILLQQPFGVISSKGQEVTSFSYIEMGECSEGFVPFLDGDYGWWWLDNSTGEYVDKSYMFDSEYRYGEYAGPSAIRPFSEGLSAVKWEKYGDNHSMWGFFNTKGEEVVPCSFYEVGDFHEGFAWVRHNETSRSYSFIDRKGKSLRIKDSNLSWRTITKVKDFANGFAEIEFYNKPYPYKLFSDGTCEVIMTEEQAARQRQKQEYMAKYGWIPGKWRFETPYGTIIYTFNGSGESGSFTEYYVSDGEYNSGEYTVKGNELMCQYKHHSVVFILDYANHTIYGGNGYYLKPSF